VKIRFRLAAIASVIAIMALGLVGAGAASASSTSGGITYFCNTRNGIPPCLYSQGFRKPVKVLRSGSLTGFTVFYSKQIDGHTYSEYEQNGTKNCLEYANTADGYTNIVRMDTCTGGRASQLWWWDGLAVINHYNGNCLTNESPIPNYGLAFVDPCTGDPNQWWSS
jgi:hypothetical protein